MKKLYTIRMHVDYQSAASSSVANVMWAHTLFNPSLASYGFKSKMVSAAPDNVGLCMLPVHTLGLEYIHPGCAAGQK